MSNKSTEHLSSLMDGEVSEETGLFLARRMCADSELGETWGRYHMIRDCLRSPRGEWSVSQVRLSVEATPAPVTAQAPAGAPAWLRPLSGLAIAASVALVAVLAVVPQGGEEGATDAVQPFTAPNPLSSAPVSDAASFNGATGQRQQLNDYLARHRKAAGTVSPQGFIAVSAVQASEAADPSDTDDEANGEAAGNTTPQR